MHKAPCRRTASRAGAVVLDEALSLRRAGARLDVAASPAYHWVRLRRSAAAAPQSTPVARRLVTQSVIRARSPGGNRRRRPLGSRAMSRRRYRRSWSFMDRPRRHVGLTRSRRSTARVTLDFAMRSSSAAAAALSMRPSATPHSSTRRTRRSRAQGSRRSRRGRPAPPPKRSSWRWCSASTTSTVKNSISVASGRMTSGTSRNIAILKLTARLRALP